MLDEAAFRVSFVVTNSIRSGTNINHKIITSRYFRALDLQGQTTVQAAIGKSDPRTDPRSNVFLIATCSAENSTQPVKVRNLSVHGALLEGEGLPVKDAPVSLRRGSLRVAGIVAWRDGTHCGIRFDHPIEVEDWVKRIGSQGQQKVDAAIADLRGGLTTNDRIVPTSRNEVVASASTQLLEICERIAALPGMSLGLAEELVKLDAIGHSLKAVR